MNKKGWFGESGRHSEAALRGRRGHATPTERSLSNRGEEIARVNEAVWGQVANLKARYVDPIRLFNFNRGRIIAPYHGKRRTSFAFDYAVAIKDGPAQRIADMIADYRATPWEPNIISKKILRITDEIMLFPHVVGAWA